MLALEVDDIGPSLRFATAKVERVQRNGGAASAPAGDAWNTGAPAADAKYSEEPPF